MVISLITEDSAFLAPPSSWKNEKAEGRWSTAHGARGTVQKRQKEEAHISWEAAATARNHQV
jgi:hypothetical protein